MLAASFGVEARVVLASEGIEVTADALDRLRNLLGRTSLRALEEHVLDEMRSPMGSFRLEASAHADPNTDAHTGHVRHECAGDGHAVTEAMDLRSHFQCCVNTVS